MKPKYPIIAFTGPAGAGKTTAAKAIAAASADGVVIYSFADPIRLMLRAIGVPIENLVDPAKKEISLPAFGGKSARQLMQSLGTEWGRTHVDPALWISVAARNLLHFLQGGVPIVIDDLRFDNEAEIIRDMGGIVIEVTLKGGVRGSHASERGISSGLIDAYFTNEKTPAFMERVVGYCISRSNDDENTSDRTSVEGAP